jgi:hypothetical protein
VQLHSSKTLSTISKNLRTKPMYEQEELEISGNFKILADQQKADD